MSEGIKQTVEAVANHPKVAIGVTAMFTSNAWLDYGEPIIKALTSLLGLAVLVLLIVKHILDIKKEYFTRAGDKRNRRSTDNVKGNNND